MTGLLRPPPPAACPPPPRSLRMQGRPPDDSPEEEEMSCRIGSTSSDDSRKSLLPLHASGDDERKHGQSTRQQPTSRIAMCLCGLAILALVALSFAPQTTGSKPHRASASPSEAQSVGAILAKAGQRALGGGLGGISANKLFNGITSAFGDCSPFNLDACPERSFSSTLSSSSTSASPTRSPCWSTTATATRRAAPTCAPRPSISPM